MHPLKKILKLIKKDIQAVKNMTHTHKHTLRNVALFAISICIIMTGILLVWLANVKLPDFQSFEERKIENSTKIYDRTGKILLYNVHQDIKRTVVPLEEMGKTIQNATIAIEDWKFYEHKGIRPTSIVRAILTTISGGKVQGGSTITQQVIKNTLLTQEKTITRKLKEWVLAIKLEQVMTKDQILATYLNDAPYGGNLYGVEEASHSFFGIEPINLTITQSAYLAAIPQSPTYYSPYGKNRAKLDERKNLVLSKMHELGYITSEEYTSAQNEVVVFLPRSASGIKAPHFVFFVIDYLNQKYGEDVVDSGGLTITTTLDYTLQEKAEELVLKYATENATKFNAKNAGLIATDPKNGQILAMVGSRNYFDTEIDGNFNITLAKRQPGSSFKPFVYSVAFNKGYTPETVLFDLPTEFSTGCNPYGQAYPGYKQNDCYMPDNYDNKFRGPISLREALAQSINVPAVKLLYLVGINNALNLASEMGITTLKDKNTYGLTLVLGGGEVTLLEMTSAYGTFATGGIRHPYSEILEIKNQKGEILETFIDRPTQILPKNTALLVSSVLSDNNARTPTFGANSPLRFSDRNVAVKTGTTNNNRDAWIIGYTPSVTIGVWAGNNENTPMTKTSGYIVANLWHDAMAAALQNTPNEPFESPDSTKDYTKPPFTRGVWQGGESFLIDTISNKLATDFTPEETIKEKVITNVHTILNWVNKDNPLGPQTQNGSNDPQFKNWETPIQNWWATHKTNYEIIRPEDKPTEYDNIHTRTTQTSISIQTPFGETEYDKREPLVVSLQNNGVYPLQKVDFFVNNIFIGTSTTTPFEFTFTPSEIQNIQTENTLRVVAVDIVNNRSEATRVFQISE